MPFAGVNVTAVVIAAAAGWITGAVWYALLAKPWMAALGKTAEQFKQQAAFNGTPRSVLFIVAFVAELVMAWVLAGLLGHLGPGQVTWRNGVISAGFVWVGFVATTMVVNNAFAGRKSALLVIDAGHWLAVLAVMGVIIGGIGVD